MKLTKLILLALATVLMPSAAMAKKATPQIIDIDLPSDAAMPQQFNNLDYGLRIQVVSNVDDSAVIDTRELSSKEAKQCPQLRLNSGVKDYVEQYVDRLARSLGFKVGTSYNTDYILKVTVDDLRYRIKSFNAKQKTCSTSAAMVISWELLDADRRTVIARSSSTGRDAATSLSNFINPIFKAYVQAFNGIDWEAIAQQLKKGHNAKQEANKQVEGTGNTALESTVIRWYISSRPQGADVSWRVISSTPDVKNTNSNYVGSTPYETTESFDIKGLTYNNSGNVQIEITCERPGYLPQKKRFNVRQAIDQKEISAKFNLVKETADSPEE